VRFPQDRHEALFRSHLEKFNCFVEQGKELIKFEQHDDHVVVYIKTPDSGEETVHCQWLVGSDGAHSIVRKQLAIPFVGTTEQERQMLTGDILIHGGLDREVGGFASR
jgi:2-polyprenyl-6-methoxyphenol hydroxylase-like FAD-dependent oxidoreductase